MSKPSSPRLEALPAPALLTAFRQRSFEPEIMDEIDLPDEALFAVLRELDRVNQLLGGHRSTLWGLKQLLGGVKDRVWRIVDVGCGSGDTLREISKWGALHGYHLELTGVDMHKACLHYAKANSPKLEINWVCADYQSFNQDCDIILSSLFCHHLNDQQMHEFCVWLKARAGYAYLINDLHRHPLAYYGFILISQCLSRSEMVKYDGPLSVRKAFRRQELQQIFQNAGLYPRITWHWAFRYLIVGEV